MEVSRNGWFIAWKIPLKYQLIGGLSHYVVWVSTIQDGAGFRNHPQYVHIFYRV
jgi:hypothetical protein